MTVRLRQAVLVGADLEATVSALRAELGVGAPYNDRGVGAFGLQNAVCALGDTFVEVVSPVRDDAPAARHRARLGGDGGYMLMVQVDDLEEAERRAAALGVRVVWRIDLEDIAGRHLHPADIGGTLLSLDRPEPPQSWRWAGPDWTGGAGSGPPGRVSGATVAVADPAAVASRWAEVLGVAANGAGLALGDSKIQFVEGDSGLIEVLVDGLGDAVEIAGVRFRPPA